MYKITEDQLKELLKIAFIMGVSEQDLEGAPAAAESLFMQYLDADTDVSEQE